MCSLYNVSKLPPSCTSIGYNRSLCTSFSALQALQTMPELQMRSFNVEKVLQIVKEQ